MRVIVLNKPLIYKVVYREITDTSFSQINGYRTGQRLRIAKDVSLKFK
jgi:hypothetical protein